MPKGKGTYGKKRGRPPLKKKLNKLRRKEDDNQRVSRKIWINKGWYK